jgi:type I restriction enzyme S subunit
MNNRLEAKVQVGFKQTEVGLIPEDWKTKLFREIFKVNQGLQIAIDQRHKHPSPISKKYITIQYLNDGKSTEYINDYSDTVCCNESDILMTRTGNTGMVITNVDGVFHNNFFKINFDRSKLNKDYIVFYLKQNSTQKKILDKAGTSTIPDLNHNDFYSLEIPLPPTLSEQMAIATALSDIDEFINSLDKLIAKKKAIKQGAMQELLGFDSAQPTTPRKRLPGFSGEWEDLCLGNILSKNQLGGNYPNSEYPTRYPLIKMGNLGRGSIKLNKIEYIKSDISPSNLDLLSYGDVLFNTRNTLDLVGKISIWRNEFSIAYFNSNLMRLAFHKTKVGSNFFMNYLLNSKKSIDKLRGLATGTTSVAAIYTRDLLKLEVCIPEPKEQKAIAQILSDIDLEIDSLETKREKYKSIKEGMMQELLTGKTRLV